MPELIVTDIRMPGSMDGLTLLKVVRADHPTLPVIVVSGHIAFMGKIYAQTEFITKPYSFDRVHQSIKMLLYASAEDAKKY
ncbi:response regulator [Sphingorhabdus sp.]|uniref:response regulator n=1 Tax=Sphingorhabdus sp. TaxID=1902408 RepID=UPI00391A0F16